VLERVRKLAWGLTFCLLFAGATFAAEGPFHKGDRVAFVGSSSTHIGVWPKTVEFLLRTRHPELDLTFQHFTTGGGTFGTGLQHFDEWLGDFKPNVVIYNYGANDAGNGRPGLPRFLDEMTQAVKRAEALGARVILVTPQAADARKAGKSAAAKRTLYAETMLSFGRAQGWTVIDVHHPIDVLQRSNQALDPAFSILKDTIHLSDPAYVAWGLYAYDGLNLPFVRSDAVLKNDGSVTSSENCTIEDISASGGRLTFTRLDSILPILPPVDLPPRLSVPLEEHSLYLLTVTGLPDGKYEVLCEDQPIGTVNAQSLADGINLNSLRLDQAHDAPWKATAHALWEGKDLDRIGKTKWRFEVRKAP
jgi:hypothetical protein